MPAGEDAPEAQHDRLTRHVTTSREGYDGDEDLDGPQTDDEDEDEGNQSPSLRSRIASALMASGEWLERGGGNSGRGSSTRRRSPSQSRASPPSSPLRCGGTNMQV